MKTAGIEHEITDRESTLLKIDKKNTQKHLQEKVACHVVIQDTEAGLDCMSF